MHVDQIAPLILPKLVYIHLLLVRPTIKPVFAVLLFVDGVLPKLIILVLLLVDHRVDVTECGVKN